MTGRGASAAWSSRTAAGDRPSGPRWSSTPRGWVCWRDRPGRSSTGRRPATWSSTEMAVSGEAPRGAGLDVRDIAEVQTVDIGGRWGVKPAGGASDKVLARAYECTATVAMPDLSPRELARLDNEIRDRMFTSAQQDAGEFVWFTPPVPRGGPAERRDVAGRRRRAGRGVPSARCGRPVRSQRRSRRLAEGCRQAPGSARPDARRQGRRGCCRRASQTPWGSRGHEDPPAGSVGQGRLRRRAGTSRGTPAERRDDRRHGIAVGGGASDPGLVRRAGRGRRDEWRAGGDRGGPPRGQDRRLRVQL